MVINLQRKDLYLEVLLLLLLAEGAEGSIDM